MANVSAATTEAYKTYTAFKGTNALSGKTTFIIPVYKDMQLAAPTLSKATVNANGTFTLSWNKVAGASKYDLYIKQSDGSYKGNENNYSNLIHNSVCNIRQAVCV